MHGVVVYAMFPGNMDHAMPCSLGTWSCTDETGQYCLLLHITWLALDQSRSHNWDRDITMITGILQKFHNHILCFNEYLIVDTMTFDTRWSWTVSDDLHISCVAYGEKYNVGHNSGQIGNQPGAVDWQYELWLQMTLNWPRSTLCPIKRWRFVFGNIFAKC